MTFPAKPILALETAHPGAGLAVADGDRILKEVALAATPSPSRQLMPAVDRLLRGLNLALGDLAAIGVVTGPGSFTGLRVGLATAGALARAAGCPLLGVSTLACLAAGTGRSRVAAWMHAGRGEIYAGLFDASAALPVELQEETVATPAAVAAALPAEALYFVGSGAARHRDLVRGRPGAQPGDEVHEGPPHVAGAAARLAGALLAAGRTAPVEPRYLRPPDALKSR